MIIFDLPYIKILLVRFKLFYPLLLNCIISTNLRISFPFYWCYLCQLYTDYKIKYSRASFRIVYYCSHFTIVSSYFFMMNNLINSWIKSFADSKSKHNISILCDIALNIVFVICCTVGMWQLLLFWQE